MTATTCQGADGTGGSVELMACTRWELIGLIYIDELVDGQEPTDYAPRP